MAGRKDRRAGMMLRPARFDDCEALTLLANSSKASHGYDDAFMEACRRELTVGAAFLAGNETWVAEERKDGGGKAILSGFVGLGISGCRLDVAAFFVDPRMTGRGIGAKLWGKLEERALSLDLEGVDVKADPHATGFYARMGFVRIGEVPSGSIPGRVLPLMRKELWRRP